MTESTTTSPSAAAEPAASAETPSPVETAATDTDTASAAPSTVSDQTTNGVMWLTLQKWVIRILGFVTIILLTRMLSPTDFGTVAAASTVLPFFYLLADLGFAAYIVQVAKTTPRMLSTAFWFSLLAGVVLCAALFLLSPLLGIAFGDPAVTPVMQALSFWVVFSAAGSVPLALLRREMRFRVIAAQAAAAAGCAQVVALIMAFSGLGVWALVGQSLTAPLITTALVWISVKWHPSFSFDRREFLTMSRFGGQVLGVEFVAMLRAWGEASVISSTLGIATYGFMNIAQRLVQMVQDLTGGAIVPVTQVAFAKIRESGPRLRAAYLRALRMVYAVLSLPLTFVAVAAPLIVPVLFGDGWEQSYRVAQILALAGTLSVGAWLDHGLFYGAGKPGAWFVYAVIVDALTLGTTVLTVRWGLEAVAWGFLCVATAATVARWVLVGRLLQTTARHVAGPFVYVMVAVLVAGAAGWGMKALTASLPGILSLVCIGLTVLGAHLAVTAVMSRSVLRDITGIVGRSRLARRVPFLIRGRS